MTTVALEDVSRETSDKLAAFEALVQRWSPAINLVSKASLQDLRNRHTLDSAQLFRFCPDTARSWVDLGSGGGFPGIVIAILAQEARPDLKISLVESDKRKATFLRQAAQELNLRIAVHSQRIETLPSMNADVLSARALAPLVDLLGFAHSHLHASGIALFPKGVRHLDEIAEARKAWDFTFDIHPSLSEAGAATLVIRKIDRAS